MSLWKVGAAALLSACICTAEATGGSVHPDRGDVSALIAPTAQQRTEAITMLMALTMIADRDASGLRGAGAVTDPLTVPYRPAADPMADLPFSRSVPLDLAASFMTNGEFASVLSYDLDEVPGRWHWSESPDHASWRYLIPAADGLGADEVYTGEVIPVPPAVWLGATGLGLVILARRRFAGR